MKLICIFAAVLAVSVAETEDQKYDDLVAMETMELKKVGSDLTPAASAYYVPPQQWNPPPSYVPSQTWTPPKHDPIQPVHTHVPAPVEPPYAHPITASPPQVQNDYYVPENKYKRPHRPTAAPPTVIKNYQHFWPNGAYRYEYQYTDGTHVGEEGYYTDPKQTDESLVKKGWYSHVGADGKTYTVSYWADHTGYHAYGDHLPSSNAAGHVGFYSANEEGGQNEQPISNPPQQPYYPPQARK